MFDNGKQFQVKFELSLISDTYFLPMRKKHLLKKLCICGKW